ncbi:hypothetical protein LMG28614_01850 [Paraburkholderia ultramafica]|uniref:Uncharacterized protein n=1 Tax=Paraburkholderia ultramafica TaxID=1544867 RepID=A0A6S7BAQ2_9BURK|nr:hypothetical protein [Paraburkholderia ultramafica]CAB3784025.1 hypothetical protein LMG28614_01850 [Paraburkholderia ultramafica]
MQAATVAALIILRRQGWTQQRALIELGALCGKEPRTLQRYQTVFGDDHYAKLETRDTARLRALADRYYAVPLATILSRKRQ